MHRAGSRGVLPKITRCLSEAGAVKLDCWPLSTFDPEYHGARRIEQPGRGKPTRGRGENGASRCPLWTRKVKFHCHWRKLSLMRSIRDWMNGWRFFCNMRKRLNIECTFVLMTVASCKVLSVSLPQLLASRKICAARKSASLWELSCRYGTEM